MQLTITVKTAKGFYVEVKVVGPTLKSCFDKVFPALEEMPEEIDGIKRMDWTYMFLEVQR
jgi:hypothetical protein